MVAQTEEKWKRRYQEVLDEKEETIKKLAELQEKVRTATMGNKSSWAERVLCDVFKLLFL